MYKNLIIRDRSLLDINSELEHLHTFNNVPASMACTTQSNTNDIFNNIDIAIGSENQINSNLSGLSYINVQGETINNEVIKYSFSSDLECINASNELITFLSGAFLASSSIIGSNISLQFDYNQNLFY